MRINSNIVTLAIVSVVVFFTSCKSADSVSAASTAMDMAQLETLLNQKTYRVDVNVVYPFTTAATTQVLNKVMMNNAGNTANRIDVRGDGFFIEFKDGVAKAYLPFFGEQRLSSAHNAVDNAGISFDDTPKTYDISKHKKKDAYIVEFQVDDNNQTTESYDVSLTIFTSKSVEVNISPSQKQMIRYTGTLKEKKSSKS